MRTETQKISTKGVNTTMKEEKGLNSKMPQRMHDYSN